MKYFSVKMMFSGVLLVASLLIGMLFSAAFYGSPVTPAAAQAITATPPPLLEPVLRTVSVSGSGSSQITPDIARVTLGVRTEADTAQEALSQNNTQMQGLLNTLTTAGVAQVDIQTRSLQLQPRYENPNPNQGQNTPQVNGYIALNTVEMTVRDLENLGELLDSAVTAGSNQIDNIWFDVSNPQQAQEQAREAAMQDARSKAEQLAELSGAALGPVISINEYTQQPLPFDQMRAESFAVGGDAVPISPGSQSLVINVQVTWELEPQAQPQQ